jgi:hypothetical protein
MHSLASHPEYVHQEGLYQYLPPLERYLLTGSDARTSNLEAAKIVGWQYLISDDSGLAVVDLSDDIPETYSSVRRGPFANRYQEILRLISSIELENGETEKLHALEVPQYATSALALRSTNRMRLFPISLRGTLQPAREMAPSSFFSELFESYPPPKRNTQQKFDGPVI